MKIQRRSDFGANEMSMSFRDSYLASSYAATCVLAVVVVGGVHVPALGGDPLTLIPADVAGVVVFRDLDNSAGQLTRFIQSVQPGCGGVEIGALEEWLDLETGTLNASEPVVFVLSQPTLDILTEAEFSDTTAVLAFTPKDPQKYAAPGGVRESTARRIEQAGRVYYVAMRDGVVFRSGKRRVMRMMKPIAPAESMAASLDEQQKALYAKSNLFVHLPMAGWRDRINMLALLAGNMMELGMAVENDATIMESGRLILDWATAGFRSMVDQMQSFTLSADFDGDTFRLSHYHAFRADGSVSDYLRQAKRSGHDLWATLPDRPFYLLATLDWHCPAGDSVAVRFEDYMLSADTTADKISPDLRKAIHEQSAARYGQTKGSYLMLTSPADRVWPVQVLGGYYMENAEEGSRQIRFVQENSTEAFAGLMGGNYTGKFERREQDGVEYYEMKFDPTKMGDGVRRQMSAIDGENVRIQDAVVGRNYVMFAMSNDGGLLPGILRAQRQGQNIGKSARIREIASRLPTEPFGLVVMDLGRMLSAAPHMARVSPDVGAARSGAATTGQDDGMIEAGPLLGWACVIRPMSFSGHLAISAKDAIETARIAKKMIRDFPSDARRVRIALPPSRVDN